MFAAVVAASVWLGSVGASAEFTVTVPPEKNRLHVEATFTAARPVLEMDEGSYSDGVEGGLAGFVENLSVARADGSPVSVTGPTDGRWQIDAPEGAVVTVRYDVRLDHEKHKWPFGADEIAYTRDESVFFVSRSILIANSGIRDARVRFVVPEGWRVAAPWSTVGGEAFAFDVPHRRLLAESCILAGDFIEREVRAGDTVVNLAIGHALAAYAEKLDAALRAVLPAFRDVFQDAPQSQFLAVVNAHTAPGITNGSAYLNSISMLTPQRMEGINYDQAIYTIAHEVLHLWNGHRMRPAEQMEWFREGFTDYLTWRTLAALKLVDEAALLRELKRQAAAYLNLNRTVTIADAGDHKAQNAVLVYEGGSLAALCLDSLMREHSGGARGIADFMRAVYAQSALQNMPYNDSILVSAAGEIAGHDLQAFFDAHINGMEPLPLDERLAAMGLRVERTNSGSRVSMNITPDESATGAAAVARDAFLGRN